MTVAEVLRLKEGSVVVVPEDRLVPAHAARIRSMSTEVQKSFNGTPFVWVTIHKGYIKGPDGRFRVSRDSHVWPSNRLQLF